MPHRWLTALAALALALSASPALADTRPTPTEPPAPSVTREDVLEGRASPEQARELFATLLSRVADAVVGDEGETASTTGAEPLGGYPAPELAADLDGDGDDELILSQWTSRHHLAAVDDRGVLWRQKVPKKVWIWGLFRGDFTSEPGEELLVVGDRGGGDSGTALALFGEGGLAWSDVLTDAEWAEVNGLVEADGDEQTELALSVWTSGSGFDLLIVDGSGDIRSAEPPASPLASLGSTQTFVTDGPDASEVVYATRFSLLPAYHVERRSLVDGSETASEVVPGESLGSLYQGPDYTGDGRRDAFMFTWDSDYGVFDGDSLRPLWTKTPPEEAPYPYPVSLGDADGDGGADLCLDTSVWDYDEATGAESVEVGVVCEAGATGDRLWEVSRSVQGVPYAWGFPGFGQDLDGDAIVDPILYLETYGGCTEYEDPDTGEIWYECEGESEVTAVSGRDGSELWHRNGEEAPWWFLFSFSGSDLDGVPGDDLFESIYDPAQPEAAAFEVRNGLSLGSAWTGSVPTGGKEGWASDAIGADVDGDGASEAVVTAMAWEVVAGDPECWDPCEFEEYAFVAAFDPGGALLWSIEV